MLISFDGIDSSGKATQARRLAERLRLRGQVVHEFATPDYATPSGQELKRWLQGKNGDWHTLPWQDKMKLFARNRAEKRDQVVSALERGEVVVYDRYIPSSLAFVAIEAAPPQAVDQKRAEIHQAVEDLEYNTNRMPREDVSIFLDVPVAASAALLEKRKKYRADSDEYTDHIHIMERLYNEYDILCQKYPMRFMRIKAFVGAELLGIDEVAVLVWENIVKRFPQLTKK